MSLFLRFRETHNALQLPVFFFSFFFFFSWLCHRYPGISGNSEQKTILQTIKQLIQFTVLGIHFRSLKYMSVISIRKNLSNIPFLFKQYLQAEGSVDNLLQTVLKHLVKTVYNSNCSYDKSIIILLK